MTSRQHQEWIDAGRPDSGLARPLEQLGDVLASAGYTVFRHPNYAHLDAQPPEDHTYYSETGWPGKSPKWWRHAIDVMPRTQDVAGGRQLQAIGARIVADRNAGFIPWLKYINWPGSGDLSHAVQDAWEPGHVRRSSTDIGHLHLSSITGVETLNAPYNPLVSVVLTGTTTPGGAHMVLGDDDVLAIADAVAQWATVKGSLPSSHLGASVNLQALHAQIVALQTDVGLIKAAVNPSVPTVPAVFPSAKDIAAEIIRQLGSTPG